ncbi:spectrin beta chain, erythrocytic-like isoform X2 [Protopterus annectens]|uniref:spectrin beta chain, erythrocytic-like isoform X2 n=1 Tax=Protopterus annectens TaxID=7888 RepID=UPI001CFB4B22|nr:spectrin beta chain, erythrocytic-like isoform X2 [Protopterus annectens]
MAGMSPGHNGPQLISQFVMDGRFRQLKDEREVVQKKTFTKWVNSHLARVTCRISDLYMDLRDGRMLIKLLEVLSGEQLPKPTKGRMRIHCLENVDKALQFLKEQRVHLENMGSHDIVDGNHRLILGLIWTIILRFQIQDIVVETQDLRETRSAKDALLLWCQMKTAGYPNVNVTNFTSSWKDGLAFNALIHKHRPDLVEYDKLKKSNAVYNLQNAFNTAEKQLGVTKLLDPEDVYTENPDEKSIITYVVAFYHYFSKMKALAVEGKRIGKVLDRSVETEKMIGKYETLASDLLTWIEQTIIILNSRKLANSLTGVQQQLQAFNTYHTVDKPPKFQEKGNLEVLLFTIQSKMRANNQKVYTPREGKLVYDINRAWERLEKAEHERGLVLRNELIRQEKLEQLARRFDRKAQMRETWLSENQLLVAQDNFGYDIAAVEAAKKKHDAIETDIAAYEERVQAIVNVADELEAERYHDVKRISARKDSILRLWKYLLELLSARRGRLEKNVELQKSFQDMLYLIDWMDEMKARLLSPDFGKHLLEVEDLLQKHTLIEADIAAQADRVRAVNSAAIRFAEGSDYKPCDPQVIWDRVNHLDLCYEDLCTLAAQRKARLEDSKRLWRFLWEVTEAESWIKEKEQIFSTSDYGKDLSTIQVLQSKHKAFEDELQGLRGHLEQTVKEGEQMIADQHFGTPTIKAKIKEIVDLWSQLEDLAAFRKMNLQDAQNLFQFQADADDIKAWLQDAYRVMSTVDVGHDEYSTQTLIKKHGDLQDKIMNYGATIESLDKQTQGFSRELRESPDIQDRLRELKDLYVDVFSLADQRKQNLQDALFLYTVFSETDACELWMNEKEKWLEGVGIPHKLEDLEVVQQRFNILDQEMNNMASRVNDVNQAANHLIETGHPSTKEVSECQIRLNTRWNLLLKMVQEKRRIVDSALSLHNYTLDCDETEMWIREKTKIVESTLDLGNDLHAVIASQRKLYGIERDLAAVQAKVLELQSDAQVLAKEHPEHAQDIDRRLNAVNSVWGDLQLALQNREASLGEASKLQKFLQDLDDFQSWLFKAQKAIASEDLPNSLPEAEKLLSDHNSIRYEILQHEGDYHKIKDTGERVTYGQVDPQYQELGQHLKDLDTGWDELQQIWDRRADMINQALGFQYFLRDAKQAGAILTKQEYTLAHTEQADTLEAAEAAIRKHDDFMATMEANKEKITGAIESGERLIDSKNIYSDKVKEKIISIDDRSQINNAKADVVAAQLKDNRDLQHFLQNCQELTFWINEKMLTAQDTSYDEARNLHSKWLKHQAFMAELASNKGWLDSVDKEGTQLMKEKPQFAPVVVEKLNELHRLWNELENTTSGKARLLFDANRSELYAQSVSDLDRWLNELNTHLTSEDYGKDLTTVNRLLKDHERLEGQVEVRKMEMEDLQAQAPILRQEGQSVVDGDDIEQNIKAKFLQLMIPLKERHDKLKGSKEVYQFFRDLADEELWVEERLPQAESRDYGQNLQAVQLLMKKNQTLQKEIQGHQPRIDDVSDRGENIIASGNPSSDDIKQQLNDLTNLWNRLKNETSLRQEHLQLANEVQQYYQDAAEAEAWMGEQELYMLVDEKAKDEQSAALMLKRHLTFQQTVANYEDTVKQLADRAQSLLALEHPDSEQISRCQEQVDKQYIGLSKQVEDRKRRLDHELQLFQLSREVEDLLQWIAERETVASSQELGQDLDHVTLLRDKFREFARDTGAIGQERVDNVNILIDELIDAGHFEAVTMADWKDNLNESWADLLELIDTRLQLLTASYDLHKYFCDGNEILALIEDKRQQLPKELGVDVNTAEAFHRMHTSFERDIHTLGTKVQNFQDDAAHLQSAYAGDKSIEIQKREQEVVQAWKALLDACDGRRAQLIDTAEKFRFFKMVRELMSWMESVIRQIETQEKPRDVSSVELLMKYHQGIMAEIDARNMTFTTCIDLGRTMLARQHYASEEIKEKLAQVTEKRSEMMTKWEARYEWLRILLEVCQFARDASLAEAWLIAQESYLASRDYGNSVDEVEKLIKRHEAFEKSTVTWEERFAALEKLTTLELLELRKHQEAARLKAQTFEEQDFIPDYDYDDRMQDEFEEQALSREHTAFETPDLSQHVTVRQPPTLAEEEDLVNGTEILEDLPLETEDQKETEEKQVQKPPPLILEPPIEEAATLPAKPMTTQFSSQLERKHEMEGPSKRASNRSWISLYCVLKNGELSFYKDAKSFTSLITYHGEEPFNLKDAFCQAASGYKKKKHVFRLRLSNGSEWLFQCKDEDELEKWIEAVTAAVESIEVSKTPETQRRAQTLPLPSTRTPEASPGRKDKEKRFSFFQKKK